MIFSGKYEVIDKIGHGGQGVVYRVRRLDFDNMELALKVLPHNLSQEPDLVARFKQEAKVMFGLHHNNIVRVYDFAKDEETYYLTMEVLTGKNLREYMRGHIAATGRGLPLDEVLAFGVEIADALAYAHEQAEPVVHRDIKPSNIIICEGSKKAVVTDFGIAKVLVEQQSDISRFGFVGTPPYCPPEQLRHDKDLDGRVDIYALGMVLFECYTGRRFVPPEWSDNEVIARVGYGSDENVVDLPDAPPPFVSVLARAIARNRDARFPTARAFTAALRECAALLANPAGAPAAGAVDLNDMGSIDAQIRALERKRHHHQAEKARDDCRKARAEAEEAGAAVEAATEFGRALEREREAEERLAHMDNQPARAIFREAAAAFESAAVHSGERRAARLVVEARDAMLASQRAAADAGAAELAAEDWARAEAMAADAAEAAARSEHERAEAAFADAAEAYRGAQGVARRAHDVAELRTAVAVIDEIRAAAERAEAGALAAEEFAVAQRDRRRLEQAIAVGQVTVARDLLARTRAAFEEAARKAVAARGRAAAEAARQRMQQAAATAHDAAAEEFAADVMAEARRHADAADAAMQVSAWEDVPTSAERATDAFARAAELARGRRDEARARATLTEARAAMEAARRSAEETGAGADAATLVGRARASAARGDAAGSNDPRAAAAEYHRAADEYAEAATAAERRARRRKVEGSVQEARDARTRARDAGCELAPSFAAADRSLDEAERALAAEDLERSVSAAAAALTAYTEAGRELERTRRLREADGALERLESARLQARESGAEDDAVDQYRAAERTYAEAQTRRRADDADAVLRLVPAAEREYEASVATALERARSACAAAKAASTKAGAPPDTISAAKTSEDDAERHLRKHAAATAAAAFRVAARAYEAATAELRVRADAAREQAFRARHAAEQNEAERLVPDAFAGASKAAAAADAHFTAERFTQAARAFVDSAAAYDAAAQAGDAARARARAASAREAADAARSAASAAHGAELAARAFENASGDYAAAAEDFAGERFADAERGFHEAARAFADARSAAEDTARARARAAERRSEAQRGAGTARASAGELAAGEVASADRIMEEAERAFAAEDFATAEAEFARALAAFQEAEAHGQRERARRDAQVSAARARAMRDAVRRLGGQGRTGGWRSRRRVGHADRVLAGGDGALASGDFVAARSRFEEAAALLATALPERWDDDATRATVLATAPAPSRRNAVLVTVGTTLVIGLAATIGFREMRRGTQPPPAPASDPGRTRPKGEAPAKSETKGEVPAANPASAKGEPKEEVASVARPAPEAPPAVQKPVQPTVVPEPPRFTALDPADAKVAFNKGATAKFNVQLADARGASYEWRLDGRTIGDSAPTVTFPADGTAHTVTVSARSGGGEVRHQWDVAAVAPPKAPEPPVLVRVPPSDVRPEVPTGSRHRFQVSPRSPANARLAYAWSIDGKPVGSDAPSWDFTTGDQDEGTHVVKVDVTDEAKQVTNVSWTVMVPPAPVTIAQQPGEELTRETGDDTELNVVAKAGDRRDVPFAYRWTVDGKPVTNATGSRFVYRMGDRDAKVQVVVSAAGRKSDAATWKLKLKQAVVASVPKGVPTIAPPPPPPAKPPVDNAERELRDWIETYRAAYQSKNVDRLISLGVIPESARDHMQRVFADLDDLKVDISDESIKVGSDGSATVAFTRKDSFRGGGSSPQPVRITKTLRKQNGSWVAR